MPEIDRVENVLLKLARGHMAFELSLPKTDEPNSIHFSPIGLMKPEVLNDFLSPQGTPFWPEIGSRAFIRAGKSGWGSPVDPWAIVQPERYQYLVSQSDGDFVRLLIGGYLACEVRWD
jgi:hypothetical protein